MKKLIFVESNRPVDEIGIKSAEEQLGIAFPKEYRSFLIENNGGLASDCLFDIPERGQSSIVFFGVETGFEHNDLMSAYFSYRDRLPDAVLPIGFDPGGNLVCVAVGKDNYGEILYWDHEKDENKSEINSMIVLSKNFGQFVDSLQYEDNESW